MGSSPTSSAAVDLFANSDPAATWQKAADVVSRINPAYDFTLVHIVFDDVMRLFNGDYPGYCPIKTPYHDRSHTLDVFLCAARLMHGVHVSGVSLSDREITLIILAALIHDIGYAQPSDGKESGTGAQYTATHIARGIEFMRSYFAMRHLPADLADDLPPIIQCSDPMLPISQIDFPNKRVRLAGQILGTADLVGQMADRNYIEKLSSLYLEFAEARIGNYRSMYDLLCKTHDFFTIIKNKLDHDFDGLYSRLAFHFNDTLHIWNNLYMESVAKNMAYLEKVASVNESEYLSMLKRGGIIEKNLAALRLH